ncbi:DUF4179 domain-containing protein [Desulforamulus ruminis]|uniref:Uncharacterized protein n=1 Tax=Desulforamulus ruminis (strain ATCC 23193 / DSM 2154 / NCIMB 8452 / DL) TaxID=696281 RepID=F6DU73_DESRL|nr:DUF4179 domain-containing protein [Desulforamulus ruminis]AEG60148.1 hypothetical protein Desru_1887 [Desulforamulus ruminis DSM 2154]
MSDIFHKALVKDAAHINVSKTTWEQVKQDYRHVRRVAHWKRRLLVYGTSAALVLIVVISTLGFVSPIVASALQKIPLIGDLYSFNYPKLDQYALKATTSATDKEITVTVPKAYYDGRKLSLIYIIEVPQKYKPIDLPQINLTTTKIQLNDEPLFFQSAIGRDSLVSTNMYRGDCYWDLSADQMSQNGTLTISIDQVGTIKGNWTLSVPVSSESIDAATETLFPQNVSSTYDGVTLTVNKVSKGPVDTTIWMQVRQQLPQNTKPKYKLGFRGMNFVIYTPNQQVIGPGKYVGKQQHHAKKIGDKEVWDIVIQCDTPSKDVKSIIVEPVLTIEDDEEGKTQYCPHLPQLAVTVPLNVENNDK